MTKNNMDDESKKLSEEEKKKKTAPASDDDKQKEINELVANMNHLISLVEAGQKRDEETRKLLEEERAARTELEEALEIVGDKSQLANWKRKKAKTGPRRYTLNTFQGKVVTSWDKMKRNLVYKNALKATVEEMVSTLHYADGTQEDVQYSQWQADRYMVPVEYAGEEVVPNEQEPDKPHRLLKVKVLDTDEAKFMNLAAGTEFKIDVIHLN